MATLPSPNPIVNNIIVTYQYQVVPSGPLTTATNISNNVSIQVNVADFVATKIVNNPYGIIGDTLLYTVTIANTGNVTGQSIVFMDTIPSGTTFVPNSLTINSTPSAFSPNPPGVSVPDINPNAIATITWQVLVTSIPSTIGVRNSAVTNYSFTIDPTTSQRNASINTNIVLTTINQAIMGSMVKTASARYAAVNDTITYTVAMRNTGSVTASSVVFTDTIPTGTTFVNDSVTVNGISQTGVFPYPPSGVSVGNIGPNQTATVTFQATVNTIPSPPTVSNNSTVNYLYTVNPASAPVAGSGNSNAYSTTIAQAYLMNSDGGLVKSINNSYAKIGDVLTYSVTLRNTGNTTANSVVITDTIPAGTTFVPNSFAINGAAQAGANPQTGVTIGNLAPGVVTTLTFNVTVASIPSVNPTNNIANISYSYVVDPSLPQRSTTNPSNTVPLQVNSAIINTATGGFNKNTNKYFAGLGDTITYTILVTNSGNVTANNVVFVDTIPAGTTFIPDSVTIDSVPQIGADPQAGIPISAIAPNNIPVVITFSVMTMS